MFDNTSASSLELLRFRPEVASAPGFERAVRESVARMATFEHPAFSRVRAVEYLDGGALALVSTHVPGRRLSEMFHGLDRRTGVHPAFVAWMIRWLTPALADLHARGAVHGALTPDRVVLAPEGRLVIGEYVFGPALERLGLGGEQLWREFGIVTARSAGDAPRLDGRGDVFQLASVALSLLVGRRLTPQDHTGHLQALLQELAASADARGSSLVPSLCVWLERALRHGTGGFESAQEAAAGLRELSAPTEPEAPPPALLNGDAPLIVEASMSNQFLGQGPDSGGLDDFFPASETRHGEASPQPGIRSFLTTRVLVAALGLVALVEGFIIASLLTRTPPAPAVPEGVQVRIESPQLGDLVMVDGREVGVTPLELNVGSAMHTIRVVGRQAPPPPAAVEEAEPRAGAAAAIALAAARQRSGGLRLVTPIDVQVLEGERVLGSSADGPIVTTAGVHQLDFVNTALGFSSRQTVEIRRGEIISLRIEPPDGRVSINALPWAQVTIDGKPFGETPLANVPLPVGTHEILFRHPQLGERRESIVVKAGAEMRVSATFGR
jgi:hypothetical protein